MWKATAKFRHLDVRLAPPIKFATLVSRPVVIQARDGRQQQGADLPVGQRHLAGSLGDWQSVASTQEENAPCRWWQRCEPCSGPAQEGRLVGWDSLCRKTDPRAHGHRLAVHHELRFQGLDFDVVPCRGVGARKLNGGWAKG